MDTSRNLATGRPTTPRETVHHWSGLGLVTVGTDRSLALPRLPLQTLSQKDHTVSSSQCHSTAAHLRDVNDGSKVFSLLEGDILFGANPGKSLRHLSSGGICEHLTEERAGKRGVDEGRTERM